MKKAREMLIWLKDQFDWKQRNLLHHIGSAKHCGFKVQVGVGISEALWPKSFTNAKSGCWSILVLQNASLCFPSQRTELHLIRNHPGVGKRRQLFRRTFQIEVERIGMKSLLVLPKTQRDGFFVNTSPRRLLWPHTDILRLVMTLTLLGWLLSFKSKTKLQLLALF